MKKIAIISLIIVSVCTGLVILLSIPDLYGVLVISLVDGGIIWLPIFLAIFLGPSLAAYYLYKHSQFPMVIFFSVAGMFLPLFFLIMFFLTHFTSYQL
jgi:hypothetical protein